MFTKVMKKIREVAVNGRETIVATISALLYAYVTRPLAVYAAPGGSYTAPLDNLKTVLVTIAGSVGVILIVYGVIRFAIAFQKMDQNGEHSAIYTIIAGGILAAISAVLAVLGV